MKKRKDIQRQFQKMVIICDEGGEARLDATDHKLLNHFAWRQRQLLHKNINYLTLAHA